MCVVPNGDLFKAIKAGTASVVTDHIDTFTEKGVLLESGTELEADIVVTATGLELLFIGGIEASVDGEVVDLPSKLTYKGMMLEGVPNFALAVGYTNASWTLKCDLTCDYVTRLLNHMHDAELQQCTPVNRDASVTAQPLLGLSSGYVQRSADRFPKQGSKFPWQVHQSYLRDYRALKRSGIEDDAMVFSNPVRDGGRGVKDFNGRVAAITGAGSGIGRALASDLARRGAHLALSDIDEVGLAETVALCEGLGVKVTSQRVDVADRAAVYAWADQVVDDHGKVNLIFNNAGVALGATIEGDVLRGLRVVDEHQLLGRRPRHQGVPAAPQGRRRGPHRQPVERVRLDQRAVAVGVQRRQVRRARLHRRVAHGARHGEVRRLVHDGPPRRHQDQHRPERTDGCERRGAGRRCRSRPAPLRQAGDDQPGEGRPPDPRRRREGQASGADRARREGDRPHLPLARRASTSVCSAGSPPRLQKERRMVGAD